MQKVFLTLCLLTAWGTSLSMDLNLEVRLTKVEEAIKTEREIENLHTEKLQSYKNKLDGFAVKTDESIKALTFPLFNLDTVFAYVEGVLTLSTLAQIGGLAKPFGELVAPLSSMMYTAPYVGKVLNFTMPAFKYGWSYLGVYSGIPLLVTLFGAKCVYDIKQHDPLHVSSHINFPNVYTATIRNLSLVAHNILPTNAKEALSLLVISALLVTWHKNK